MQDPSQPALRHEVVLGAAGLSPPAQGFLHVRDSEGGLDTAPLPTHPLAFTLALGVSPSFSCKKMGRQESSHTVMQGLWG